MADRHPAEALADDLDRMWEQLDPIDGWRPTLDAAGPSLRRIPALETERDALRAEVQALREDAERYRWLRARIAGAVPVVRIQIMTRGQYVLIERDLDSSIRARNNPAA